MADIEISITRKRSEARYNKAQQQGYGFSTYTGSAVPIPAINSPPEPTSQITIGTGEKLTGVDAGTLHQLSVTDDYLYVCVSPGTEPGTATWKKLALTQSI